MRTFDTVWDEYHDAFHGIRFYETHLTIGGIVVPQFNINSKNWSGGMMVQGFAIGLTVSQRFDVAIDVSNITVPAERLTPVVVKIRAGGELGATPFYNFGKYFISEASRTENTLTIKSFDALATRGERSNIRFSNMSMVAATTRAARLLGCAVDTSGIAGDIGKIDLTDSSIREVLGLIASANGGNFIIDFENTLRLIRVEVKDGEAIEVTTTNAIRTSRHTEQTVLDNVIVRQGNKGEISYPTIEAPPVWDGDEEGVEIESAFVFDNPLMDEEQVKKLYEQLSVFKYVPCEVGSAFINPAVGIGDTVLVRGAKTQIMGYSLSGDMKVSFSAYSSSDAFQRYLFRGVLEGRISELERATLRGGGGIIWLDHHPTPAEIDRMYEEEELREHDTVAIYDPLDIPIQGRFLGLQQGIDIFYVKVPPPFVALVTDFSFRTSALGDIRDVYTIGVSAGHCVVMNTSVYTANLDEWTQTDVATDIKPSLSSTAIEFNATWEQTELGRSFVTQDKPMVFFITTDGKLYSQRFDDKDTKHHLSSGVVHVSALRGWLHQDRTTDSDMGLIVAYIKTDGLAYYRRLVRPWTLGQPTAIIDQDVWRAEAVLPFSGAVPPFKSISVSRTNDFRVMIAIEDASGHSFCLLTHRYLQGDSIEPTILAVAPYLTNYNTVEFLHTRLLRAYFVDRTTTHVSVYPYVSFVAANAHLSFSIRDEMNRTVVVRRVVDVGAGGLVALEHDPYDLLGAGTVTITFTNTETHVGPIRVLHRDALFSPLSATLTVFVGDLAPNTILSESLGINVGITYNIEVGNVEHIPVSYREQHISAHISAHIIANVGVTEIEPEPEPEPEPEVVQKRTIATESIATSVFANIAILGAGGEPL